MCVAYPGTVISIGDGGKRAKVDFAGTVMEAMTGFRPVKEGDRVLVHAGCVLKVLPEEEANELDEIFRELQEAEASL